MKVTIKSLLDEMSKEIWGLTIAQAHEQQVCIKCKRPMSDKAYSLVDLKEYSMSGLCPECFDLITEEEDERG